MKKNSLSNLLLSLFRFYLADHMEKNAESLYGRTASHISESPRYLYTTNLSSLCPYKVELAKCLGRGEFCSQTFSSRLQKHRWENL